ncbi:hypothetical protein D3C75_1158940 [compost metagenome]
MLAVAVEGAGAFASLELLQIQSDLEHLLAPDIGLENIALHQVHVLHQIPVVIFPAALQHGKLHPAFGPGGQKFNPVFGQLELQHSCTSFSLFHGSPHGLHPTIVA